MYRTPSRDVLHLCICRKDSGVLSFEQGLEGVGDVAQQLGSFIVGEAQLAAALIGHGHLHAYRIFCTRAELGHIGAACHYYGISAVVYRRYGNPGVFLGHYARIIKKSHGRSISRVMWLAYFPQSGDAHDRLSFIWPRRPLAVYPPTMDEQPLDAGILDLATHKACGTTHCCAAR